MSDSPIITFDFWIKTFIHKHVSLGKRAAKLLAVVLVVAVAATITSGCAGKRVSKYRIPQGYVGWVRIYYDIKGAPPLPVESDAVIYNIPANGRLLTSTSQADSKIEFYYYGEQNETRLWFTSPSLIHDFRSGSYGRPLVLAEGQTVINDDSGQEGSLLFYDEFFVGTEEQHRSNKKDALTLNLKIEEELRKDLQGFIEFSDSDTNEPETGKKSNRKP